MATKLTTSYQLIGCVSLSRYLAFRLYGKYNSQSVENNQSSVTLQSRIIGTSGGSGSSTSVYSTIRGEKSNKLSKSWDSSAEVVLQTLTFTVDHSNTGTYSETVAARCQITFTSSSIDKSLSATFSLPDIARAATLLTTTDFNDEENPTITFSNPGNFTVYPYIDFYLNDTIVYQIKRNTTGATSPYTFQLTNDERVAIRKALSTTNSTKVCPGVVTYYGSTSLGYDYTTQKFTIINANPAVDMTLLETNDTVVGILGTSASSIIKGISNVKATATATPKKEATIKSIAITNGTASNNGVNPYTFVGATGGNFKCVVTDSRGNTAEKNIAVDLINYSLVDIINAEFKRVDLDSTNIVLNAEISCFTDTIKNSVNEFTITYSGSNNKTGNISSVADGATSGKIIIKDLIIEDAVGTDDTPTFTLTVQDKFSVDSASNKVIFMVPTFEAGKADFKVNGKLYIADEKGANAIEIRDLMYPIGSVYISVNNINPKTLIGGEWEQIKDVFLLGCGNTYINGSKGGAAAVKLTENEIPAHTHGSKDLKGTANFRDHNTGDKNLLLNASGVLSKSAVKWDGSHSATAAATKADYYYNRLSLNVTHEHDSVGNGAAHENMPPYLAVYMWKRTK